MINNFDKIKTLLTFPNFTSFYFLEIIKRRKENPEMVRHASLVRDFYIYSPQEFDDLRGKVIDLCNENNARAYFRLNLRDSKKIAHQYLKRIAELLITEDYKAIPKAYASVCGEFHADPDKKWLIDLDREEGMSDYQFDMHRGNVRAKFKQQGGMEIAEIPTKNGVHLITTPFRLDKEWYKAIQFTPIDIHKDNPTILYCP